MAARRPNDFVMCAMRRLFARFVPLLILAATPAHAEERTAPDPKIVRALGSLEKRLEVKFDIPFPDLDIDWWLKQPLARVPVEKKKILATRPRVNPYDEPRTVEWMVCHDDLARLGWDAFSCSIDLDEHGDFARTNLMADWASDGGLHQLTRGESETGPEFFERARLTYRLRAAKAKDPERAALLLAGFEKMATAIQALRKKADAAALQRQPGD